MDSFIALFLRDLQLTEDAAEVDYVRRQVAQDIFQICVSLRLADSITVFLNIARDGYAVIMIGEGVDNFEAFDYYVLPRSERLDYETIEKHG